MKKIHFWLGLLGILVFLATGGYMHIYHGHLREMADRPRLLYRSAHIYTLLVSVINLSLGVYFRPSTAKLGRYCQYLASSILLLSPILLVCGFFLEPPAGNLGRPFVRTGIYGLFGVGVLLVLQSLFERKK